MTPIRLLCLVLALQPVVSWGAEERAEAPGDAPPAALNPAQSLAPAILGSIRTNSERLGAVELTLSKTLTFAGVTAEGTVEETLPDGGKMKIRQAPQHTFLERAVILEDRLRVEVSGRDKSRDSTYWYDGVRWTEANTSARRIKKMHTNQLPGRMFDPRECAGLDARTSLKNILSESALKSATLSTEGTLTRISTVTGPGGQPLVVDFDASQSMLPVRSQLFHLNGAIARDAVITYAKVKDRDAYAIQSISERIYDESVDGLSTPEQWKQQLVTAVTCNVLTRDAAEQLLQPVIPAGYQVFDYTDVSTMQRKSSPPVALQTAAEFPLKWFILAHVIAIAAAAAVIFWRRRHASPV